MKRYAVWAAVLTLIVLAAMPAHAANYVKPDEFKQWLESGAPPVIVDIQPADDYVKHHFRGSFETNAFPTRTEEEKQRLETVLPKIRASKDAVGVICPRGRSGAFRFSVWRCRSCGGSCPGYRYDRLLGAQYRAEGYFAGINWRRVHGLVRSVAMGVVPSRPAVYSSHLFVE